MKTLTEFSGFDLRNGNKTKMDLINSKKNELKQTVATEQTEDEATTQPTTASGEPSVETVADNNQTDEKKDELLQTNDEATKAVESIEENAEVKIEAPESSDTPAAVKIIKPLPENQRGKIRDVKNNDWQKYEELIKEDLEKAITENFKLEGEKLEYFKNALNVIDKRRFQDLKRVMIVTFADGEKQPPDAKKIDEHYYVAEYMASLNPPKPQRGRGRHARGGRDRDRDRGRGGQGPRDRDSRGGERDGGRPKRRFPRRDDNSSSFRGTRPQPQPQQQMEPQKPVKIVPVRPSNLPPTEQDKG